MHKSFTINGIKKPWIVATEGRTKPPFASISRNLITVQGMAGAHLGSSKVEPLVINQPIGFVVEDDEHALELKDELADWLITDEPVELEFDDEPGRVYFAIVQNTLDDFIRFVRMREGTIQFLCLDPFGYGQEKPAFFPSDAVTLTNEGTAEADPIFEMEVLEPVTFAMIQNQDGEYQMIGRPAAVDESTFEKETLIMHETMSTLTGWAQGTFVDNGYVSGEMATDGGAFIASAYGNELSPRAWQGPARKKSLSETLQDFRADILVEQLNTVGQTGMIEIYFLDASNNTVAKIGIEDIWQSRSKIQGKFQLGDLDNRESIYVEPHQWDNGWNNFDGILRIVREGNLWRPYWAKIQPDGTHVWRANNHKYVDVEGKYSAPIAQVQVSIRKWPLTNNITQKVKDIKVYKINDPADNQIPYVAHEGDVITFDHKNDEILVNGEDRTDLKAFGGQYFKLAKGINQLIVQPSDSFETRVRYRQRYR